MSIGNEGTRAYGGPVTQGGPRAYLFVQTGGKRPKVAARYTNPDPHQTERIIKFVRLHPDCNPTAPMRSAAEADEWWLVECKNARGGLWMIAPEWCNGRTSWPPPTGRILASGGKETTE